MLNIKYQAYATLLCYYCDKNAVAPRSWEDLRLNQAVLDRFDLKIMAILQESVDVTAEYIGESVGLSASAVQRRIRTLKKNKVIKKSVAVLDSKLLGHSLTLVAFLETTHESRQDRQTLKRWCASVSEIQQAYYVTGSYDLVLLVVVPDMETFEDIMSNLQDHNPSVRKITTNVCFEVMKQGLEVAIET